MAKPKSIKTRLLKILQILYKETDTNHPMKTIVLHGKLRNYGIGCEQRSIVETIQILQECGFDVKRSGKVGMGTSVWLDNHPFSDEELDHLIFAVITNPYISNEQIAEILQSLKSVVTIYQEMKLQKFIEAQSK